MQVTANMVKTLRDRTGAGMMDCKKFLQEADGDMERAVDLLRKSGQIKAEKKSGRIAGEGVVCVVGSDKDHVILEVNCETDFVARDENFNHFVQMTARAILEHKPQTLSELMALVVDGKKIEDARLALVSKIGENIQVRRFEIAHLTGNTAGVYRHGNRIGVLVDMSGGDEILAKDIAMHVAANRPLCVTPESAPADILAREKAIFEEQSQESGKSADIVEKMVTGKVRKYLSEISLMEQAFVKDPDKKVSALLKENNAQVHCFYRYEVGEGIAKKQENFADEVMAQIEASNNE